MSIDDGRAPAPEQEQESQPASEDGNGGAAPATVAAPADPAPGTDATPDVEASPTATRVPQLGDLVIYHVMEQDDPATRHNAAKDLPAIVVAVWDAQNVNLKIITDGPVNVWKTSVVAGDGPGGWSFRD